MKSQLLKRMVKGLAIAGAAFALVNCNDASDTVNAAISDAEQQIGEQQGSGDVLTDPTNPGQTVTDPSQDPLNQQGSDFNAGQAVNPGAENLNGSLDGGTESQNTDPVSNPDVMPGESSSSEGEVGPGLLSSSSEVVVEESSSSEAKVEDGVFLAEGTDENKDQMQIEYIENIEPCIWDNDKHRNLCKILAYPKQLSETQKHAVVMWGPGGGSDPKDYGGIIKRLASHGFVVVAIPQSPGDASQGKPALDWLESKNKDPNDPLYNKLDMTKVGCSGHSMGGLESEQMLIKDDRVITAMLNNSGDLGHTAMSYVSPNKTIGIVYGEGGMERPNAEADYNNQGVRAPACLLKMTGGQGNECQQGECGWGHGSGPWGGMAATVAWMRWHLGGEDFRKADFVGMSGKYIDGAIIGQPGNWKGQCKNF